VLGNHAGKSFREAGWGLLNEAAKAKPAGKSLVSK
jgi:hypothetical protein